MNLREESVSDLGRRCGLTQTAVAPRIDSPQSHRSKAERHADSMVGPLVSLGGVIGLRGRILVEDETGRVVGPIVADRRLRKRCG